VADPARSGNEPGAPRGSRRRGSLDSTADGYRGSPSKGTGMPKQMNRQVGPNASSEKIASFVASVYSSPSVLREGRGRWFKSAETDTTARSGVTRAALERHGIIMAWVGAIWAKPAPRTHLYRGRCLNSAKKQRRANASITGRHSGVFRAGSAVLTHSHRGILAARGNAYLVLAY